MDHISGQLISPTNAIHRIPDQFVNKPKRLFCDRALFIDWELLCPIGRASLMFILRDVTRFTPLLARLVQ